MWAASSNDCCLLVAAAEAPACMPPLHACLPHMHALLPSLHATGELMRISMLAEVAQTAQTVTDRGTLLGLLQKAFD